jgi:hypothetical protein
MANKVSKQLLTLRKASHLFSPKLAVVLTGSCGRCSRDLTGYGVVDFRLINFAMSGIRYHMTFIDVVTTPPAVKRAESSPPVLTPDKNDVSGTRNNHK